MREAEVGNWVAGQRRARRARLIGRSFWCGLVFAGCMVAFPAQAKPRPAVVVSGVLNINEATLNQLDELPGISVKLAQSIVDERKRRRFARMDDLLRVKGIGRKRLRNLRGLLVFSGPSTFRVVERRGE